MKRFFIFLLLLLTTVWIGSEVASDPGYVLIARHKVAIEMPLWLAVIGLIVGVMIVYFLIRVLCHLMGLPRQWSAWIKNRQQENRVVTENQDLLTTLYQKPTSGDILLHILPELAKKNWLSPTLRHLLEYDCHENIVQEARHSNAETFAAVWNQLPSRFRKDEHFLGYYIDHLIQHHNAEKAELLTRQLLKRRWLSRLVKAYGLIDSQYPERQLTHAERWLKHHPQDPTLLLTLGRLCKQLKLWGKAKDYLETSLLYNASPQEIHQELGALFEILGDPAQALRHYKAALK